MVSPTHIYHLHVEDGFNDHEKTIILIKNNNSTFYVPGQKQEALGRRWAASKSQPEDVRPRPWALALRLESRHNGHSWFQTLYS